MNSEELSNVVVKGMEERKAEDIVVMDLRKVKGSICDFFVICSGNSDTQIEAIAKSIESEVDKKDEKPWRKEGFTNREWILIDYVSVVAHIFRKDKRQYYGLEDLWGDAIITSKTHNA
ncbi:MULTISPECIES: ribosome silencing factor [Roseivirga]|jgi:ribosome-associated protein|uniref:Ribosomal silencing factor RsfS n=1 Tax=Roseivirga spongicola TaxID=333140 RepID=A0A150XB61_9BACT|nr:MULTISPECIES: ribosome silencing factor [Roseivirga]PWL29035.1 MAG: ribosome silencing factor [Roseivirga sp. XM-24bin3]KYG75969.1 ribosome silencing factor [Roseivirga spongicola]MBO6496400.1 ribosome silencing factor [Roseivirga sp.]MBO6659145.1 ribosome silencing factor [Roseivirga sp.]MBO6759663.1 ribosome silencing factor [Roseivirga sp.]|tara:strand:- start:261 stop:614 length:354 start_codon:yes stop_codon:yes gene_type:complete